MSKEQAIAWIRIHPDHTWTDDVMLNWQIEQVRKDSGAWVPLYAWDNEAEAKGNDDERWLRALVKEAPHYFHPGYDFDGKKLEWLNRARLV